MDSVLIVSSTEKSVAYFTEILSQNAYREIVTASSCGEARRLFIEKNFDLCIINAPLPDEFGVDFALGIAAQGISQVILFVKAEFFDEISSKVEDMGVFTISKPIGKGIFWSALKLAGAAYHKMSMLHSENQKLLQKIEDIRIVDRAKCILVSYLKMTEPGAHKYIEKQAMNMRMTRRKVAENIIKTYEN